MVSNEKYSFSRFFLYLAVTSFIAAAIAYYPVSVYAERSQINSFIPGYLISLVNALIGYKLSLIAFNKSVKSFMVIVFGGMGIRLLIVVITLLILIQFTTLDPISLAASVFFFYTLFVCIEIFFLHKLSSKKGNKEEVTMIENKV
ncbi:MAG: hypothetical protein IT281_04730 [Ignavibacteria bacterium]|nr:hypothetical protein [Ignavibacteria bacterium]MCC7158823.1 hypothetical protein [Ignavibacteria bacterium]